MSDAMTDIARDERRIRCFDDYLSAIKKYLGSPIKENLKKAVEAAEETDSVPDGYWAIQTNLAEDAEKTLKNLKKGNRKEWEKFLSPLKESGYYRYREFKKISPFCLTK